MQSQAADAGAQNHAKAIGERFAAYVEALNEVGKKQIDILALFGKRDEVEAKWTRTFNTVINSGMFGMTPNAKDVEAFINEAASQFKDARTSGWRYFVLNEKAQIKPFSARSKRRCSISATGSAMRSKSRSPSAIGRLVPIVPEFAEVLNATIEAIDQQNRIQHERADTAEAEAHRLLTQASVNANEQSVAATSAAAAGVVEAARIRMAVGIIVILVLIGTATFAALTIGRPVRRLGEILMQLAQGNKAVEIPYTQPYRRGRRHGARREKLPRQPDAGRASRNREAGRGGDGRRLAQVGDASGRRRIRDDGRQHRRGRFVGGGSSGGVCGAPGQGRRNHRASLGDRRQRLA